MSLGPVAPSKRLGGAQWSRVSPEFSACAGTEAPTVKQLFECRCDVLSSHISCVCFVSMCVCLPDPAPVLEASHTLEGRLQQLQSSAPDTEALVREISGHWRKHLEKTGEATPPHRTGAAADIGLTTACFLRRVL